ncbi:LysR family transcriptional regulator [Ruegeria marina]|uniref:LysR family transcriptional regulator, nitrogen assimilation regulatory protein n=1 Tax=Ruegeria marina TaxID=639004 RepID=A0A1G6TCM2_9RHOB|nr:LysR family transcriptional regulator [Ruegeria marina]SDD26604.1 LysR family transcriptional regulator, nitrogen assimilation regulatory protein [Ruegeria marina]
MDIRQLRYFVAIAEEGSLSAAAQRVNVAQPSLSQHVIALERELDVTLLDRSPRGVSLTESGEVLLSHAREVIAALERTRAAVRESGSEPQGEVSFGLPSSIAMVLSVPLAETVRLELPKVRLRAIDAMSGFIKTWLEDQSIDLGMLYDIASVGHLSHRQLMTEELHFFSAPDAWPFHSRAGSPVRFADLAEVELVLPSPHHGLRSMIDRFARGQGVSLNVATEMDALAQIKIMVSRSSGYTILAPAAAIDFVERGELIMAPIVKPAMVRPVYLVRNPARPVTRASLELERITLEVIRDLVARGIWQAFDPAAR